MSPANLRCQSTRGRHEDLTDERPASGGKEAGRSLGIRRSVSVVRRPVLTARNSCSDTEQAGGYPVATVDSSIDTCAAGHVRGSA